MSPFSSAKPEAAKTPGAAGQITVNLPDRLDFDAAQNLTARLAELRGVPVLVDGKAVICGGALGAQVLLAASREWARAGDVWEMTVSTALREDLHRLGILSEFSSLVEVE